VVSLETSGCINDDRDSRLEGGLRVRLGVTKRLPDPCVFIFARMVKKLLPLKGLEGSMGRDTAVDIDLQRW
jgi:hypothetical protein